MSTIIYTHKFYNRREQRNAATRSYAPYVADVMSLGRNVRKAITALKPGQAIDLRYEEFVDRVIFDHPKHDKLTVVRRFRMNKKNDSR